MERRDAFAPRAELDDDDGPPPQPWAARDDLVTVGLESGAYFACPLALLQSGAISHPRVTARGGRAELPSRSARSFRNALRRLPRAFLWLTRVTVRKDTSTYARENLALEAAAHGVQTDRLAFSFKFPQDDYIAFRALADLMVDNRAYNAHTTGSDALWAAVPLLTLPGETMAARVAGSLARAAGAADGVVATAREYADAAIELVGSAGVQAAARAVATANLRGR